MGYWRNATLSSVRYPYRLSGMMTMAALSQTGSRRWPSLYRGFLDAAESLLGLLFTAFTAVGHELLRALHRSRRVPDGRLNELLSPAPVRLRAPVREARPYLNQPASEPGRNTSLLGCDEFTPGAKVRAQPIYLLGVVHHASRGDGHRGGRARAARRRHRGTGEDQPGSSAARRIPGRGHGADGDGADGPESSSRTCSGTVGPNAHSRSTRRPTAENTATGRHLRDDTRMALLSFRSAFAGRTSGARHTMILSFTLRPGPVSVPSRTLGGSPRQRGSGSHRRPGHRTGSSRRRSGWPPGRPGPGTQSG